MLRERGVKTIRALRGGWQQWVAEGNAVTKP